MSSDCSCSICCDDITSQTGSATLSCAHSFHIRCITSWFATQEKGTCPMCRKEMSEIEDLAPIGEEDEEESEDEEDEEEDEEEQIMLFMREELDQLLRSLGGVGVTATMDFFQGFPEEQHLEPVATLTRIDIDLICAGNGASMISDEEWDRRYLIQREKLDEDEEEEEVQAPLSITWLLQDDGRWVRQILNPEQDTGVSATASEIPGSTTAAFAQEKAEVAARSLQKVWRGFATRKAILETQAPAILAQIKRA